MKRFIISILLIFISLTSFSQIKVKEGSFRRIVNYVMDDKDEHIDGNYKPMALIKISTENINAEERNRLYFKGNRATDFHVEPKIGELYLYISAEAATVLEIKHPDYGKTVFTFPEPLCDFCAYELVVVYISNQKEDTAPQNTYLTVSADQDNAIIYIDDEYAGMKEATKSVGIGSTHSWRIECDLYHTENGTVTIEDRESFFIEKQLRQAYGFLSVTTEPESGAIVFIDNKNVGTTPYSSDKMASGTYNVRVVKEMYKTTEQTVTVTDGNTTEAKLSMPANFVNVTIKTDEHSDIYLDNEYKGKGSWSGRLVEGPHYAEARKTSHETSSKNFTVTLGNDLNIDIEAPKPIYGYLDIMTTPLRADVYIDGKNYGKTPKVITDLLIGNHKLRIEKEGCAPLTKDIVIKEGETLSLNETLQTGQEISISTGQNGDKIGKELLDRYSSKDIRFITLNGAYSVAPQTSFGITYGQVRKVGWFVSAMSNFDFTGFNVSDKSFNEVALTGKTKSTRLSVMGGFIVRIGGPVYASIGAGYGMRVRVCETISGDYVEYAGNTYKGIDASAGLLFNLRNFSFAFDAVTTNFKTLEFKLGIGINWKKR